MLGATTFAAQARTAVQPLGTAGERRAREEAAGEVRFEVAPADDLELVGEREMVAQPVDGDERRRARDERPRARPPRRSGAAAPASDA